MGQHAPYEIPGAGKFGAGTGTRFTSTAVTPKAPTGSWAWKAPAGVRTRILAVYANPVTGATVGNREPVLQLRDPSNFHIASIEGGPVIPASVEKELFWILGVGGISANIAANFTRQFGLWDFMLDENFELLFEMFGGVAGDTIGEARIFGETYPK